MIELDAKKVKVGDIIEYKGTASLVKKVKIKNGMYVLHCISTVDKHDGGFDTPPIPEHAKVKVLWTLEGGEQ